jgi:sugar lactone lactonase YvrE
VYESVFPFAIESPAQVLNELEIEGFHSDYVAVVAPPEGSAESSGLLSSTLPLRAENEAGEKELIDLDLESVEGHLEPENPLVPVEIPAELSEGISFPESNITISVGHGETERAASEPTEGSAFYPNIRANSDLVVNATPTGVETYTQLRSADSPDKEIFELAIPSGSSLKATGPGGAEVVDADGNALLSVSVPWAMDAAGEQVPANLEVAGDSITVTVDPPADAALPILVDPVFESYNFTNVAGEGSTDWKGFSNKGFNFRWGSWPGNGMTVESIPGAQTSPGNQASFNYHVPRFYTDPELPTTYIRDMKLWGLTYGEPDESGTLASRPAYPFMQVSMWSETKKESVAIGTRFGYEGPFTDPNYVFDLKNPNENTDVKSGGFSIATWDSVNPPYLRYVNVKQASVELTDQDLPGFGEIGSISPWVSSAAGPAINYKTTDTGLGIHDLRVRYPAAEGGRGEATTSLNCTGTAGSPCPRTASKETKALSYNPAQVAQGESWLQIYAVDPVGHWSEVAESKIKVDRTAPELDLTGTLTEQGTLGTQKPSYSLSYNAKDGDEATAVAASPYGTTGTGEGQLERPLGVATDSAGNVWTADVTNNRVVEYDKNGKFVRQFGTAGTGNGQFNTPRGIAIAPNGTVWVADYGNKRLQAFTAQGAYIRQIVGTDKVEGPYAVAAAKDGSIWVSDINTHKLKHFSETGAALESSHDAESAGQINGLAIDSFGDLWATSYDQNKVYEYDSKGNLKFSFGSEGTGNGQFKGPLGIAFAPSGNFFVADDKNNRIQEFKPDGGFMRQFGTEGSANNQLKEPRWVAVGQGNTLFIGDAGNHRLARWQHADRHVESGVTAVEIRVDGVLKEIKNPGCATKNCALSGEWTMNADSYSVGKHKVEVIAIDGVNLATTKTLEIETHGDLAAPSIALSGSMTEQAIFGTTRPAYTLKETATDPGSSGERKSGVASTKIKVDGTVVDSYAPGCSPGECSITREWTLNSNSFSVGSHQVVAEATDSAGHTSSKTFTVNIARDTTAPLIEVTLPFYTAPEGWLEQKSYSYNATATDSNGYGVTALTLKIDGAVVASTSQTCSAGGCAKSFGSGVSVNMSAYKGGSHSAELIATDGAGNARKRAWTINVDPAGQISAGEAESTLEALDATSPVNTVGEAKAEMAYEGTTEGLAWEEVGGEYVASGSATPTGIGSEGAFTVEVSPPPVSVACENEAESSAKELTGAEEEALALAAACKGESPLGASQDLIPVEVTPVGGSPTAQELAGEGSALVEPNTASSVDLVTRPLYDGAMTFAAIRDAAGSESFSWEVSLEPDQELKLVDSQNASVDYTDGIHHAFSIIATPAHDAIGTTVPTELTVSGKVLTLKVKHHTASYVYPVVGGAGWEGGFQTYQVEMPPPAEEEPGQVEVLESGDGFFREATVEPPQPDTSTIAEPYARQNTNIPVRKRGYHFFECTFHKKEGWEEAGSPYPPEPRKLQHGCHGETPAGFVVTWAVSQNGHYKYKPHLWSWAKKPECKAWGPNAPAVIHEKSSPEEQYDEHVDAICDYRFAPGKYQGGLYLPGQAECYRLDGPLPDWYRQDLPGEKILEKHFHVYRGHVWPEDPCDWSNLDKLS